jgi:hypothetical protein
MAKQIIIKGTPVVAANEVLVADSSSKIPAVDGSAITTMAGGNIAGTIPTARLDTGTTANKVVVLGVTGLPAVDGSLLTGIVSHTTSASNPTISTNPSGGVGSEWINSTSGKQFICTDATAGENVWKCSGGGSGDVAPIPSGWYGTRGVTVGGYGPYPPAAASGNDVMDYVTIATVGNSTDFGNLTSGRRAVRGTSNGTRGVAAGGVGDPSDYYAHTNLMDYVTIATTGNAADFGDLVMPRNALSGWPSNDTRAIFCGGYSGLSPDERVEMDYITPATLGNASDFGDMTTPGGYGASVTDGTSGLIGGIGNVPGGYAQDLIQKITIATLGNAIDWGADLDVGTYNHGSCSSLAGRGVWFGTGDPASTTIQYVTIATVADALDFGNLVNTSKGGSGNQNETRGVMNRGDWLPTNEINYITMATTGNALDFGNLTEARQATGAFSGS